MPFFETPSGVSIHYESKGEGHPVVFIHGWSMSGRVWRYQADAFASSYRVVTVDLRGHGESSRSVSGYSLKDFASDIAELFENLELQNAVITGWSMGAQIALQSFARLRKRIAALVLVGGTPRFTSSEDWPFGLPQAESRGMAIRLKRNYTKTMGEFFEGMFSAGELSHESYMRIARDIVMGGVLPLPETALKTLETLNSEDLRSLLPDIDAPVLLVHGADDKITMPDASLYMVRILPHAAAKIIDRAGHAPFLSRAEEFNSALLSFLEEIYGRD
jgi:pimeloyl-ACP methyl ester esterase